MLARSGQLPRNEQDYGFEVKWDGIRTVLFSDHGHITAPPQLHDFTPRYPEVREFSRAQGARRLILDGEIVAFDNEGRPSFERLQSRMHLASDSAVRRACGDTPVTYVIFDLLYLDGRLTLLTPRTGARCSRLELETGLAHPAHHRGEGSAARGHPQRTHRGRAREAARLSTSRAGAPALDQGQERLDPGRGDRRLDAGEGGRSGRLGALAVGVMDDGKLVYAGKVGTGFTQEMLGMLMRELEPLRRDTSPFEGRQPRARSSSSRSWWPPSSSASGPAAGPCRRRPKGLRPDKDPQECIREAG